MEPWMEAQRQVRELLSARRFAEARAALERHWTQFPERRDYLWLGMVSCHVALTDLSGAAAAMRRALDEGCMWRVSLLADPSIAPVFADPGCLEVIEEARRRVAEREFRPRLLVEPAAGPGIHPLLLVLHGATGTAAETLPHWRGARELGFTVAAAQSSQPASADGFCWDPPRERVWADVDAIAEQLPAHGRAVLAGFSQGAWISLQAALRGHPVAAAGVVMVGPFVARGTALEPGARRLRVAVLSGADDAYTEALPELEQALTERGHHVSVEVLPDLGHGYPEDFAARLPELLRKASKAQN